ncbi:MAG: response regulator, partial [Acidobacteriota bacterium]|nr:response regulator [Acidobacteriota bacterium]
EHPILTSDGSQRTVAWSGGWLMQDKGSPSVHISLGADVTEQRHAEEAVRLSEARYRAIIEDQTELVCRLARAGELTFVNEAFCQFFSLSRDTVEGRRVAGLLDEKEGGELRRLMGRLSRDSPVETVELSCRTGDGEARWLQWTCRLLEHQENAPREFQLVGRDVTERRSAEDEMRRATRELKRSLVQQRRMSRELDVARARAEGAAAAKSRFLAHMSHEIRTPMNGVIGGIHLVLDSELSSEQRDTIEIIRSSAENLLGLINEILDFSKIEAGKLDLQSGPVDVRGLVEDVTTMLAPQAYPKGVELVSLVHSEVPEYLEGDPARLRQVLTNLLANATKFTEEGEIVVRVSVQEGSEDLATLRFEVEDTGVGIPEDELWRLFESFSQVSAAAKPHHGGTGLGLAICRSLVELMGGDIGVESEPGCGSTFWFTIPLKMGARPEGLSLPESEAELEGRRVLIADAHAHTREAIASRLRAVGCRCREVSSTRTALRALKEGRGRKRPIDVLIFGGKVIDGDSEKFGRAVRERYDRGELPMVLLTPCGLRGDSSRMEEVGFDAYLTKPIRSSALQRCLRRVLQLSEDMDAAAPRRILTRYSMEDSRECGLSILLAEDIPINQKIAARILERLGHRVDIASNGAEAVAAVRARTYDVVLMDCQMPVIDGFAATQAIRELEGPESEIPIIALTANAIKGDRERCIDAGMNDYVSKPISPESLADALARVVLQPA